MDWLTRVEAWVQRYAHLALVTVGLVLLVLVLVMALPTMSTTPDKFIDTILKLVAVIVVGALLPRITSFEFGNTKVTLTEGAKELANALNTANERLNRLEASMPDSRAVTEGATILPLPAPGMPRNPKPGDPQNGRFGRSPDNPPFRLSARFLDANAGSELVRISVEVSKDGGLTGPVTLYLHETFSPSALVIEPIAGIASIELMVWGGFTIGAIPHEAPDHLLELDLTRLPDAPRAIRER